jgi:hypothetical protein
VGSCASSASIPSAYGRCNLAGVAQDEAPRTDLSQLPRKLKERAERERASGGYPDDLAGFELEKPGGGMGGSIVEGFDLQSGGPRVRFRPELGFSTKRVVGPPITLVKRFYLRLLGYVFDDLARQTDTAIVRLETALAVEIATRERVERELEGKIRELVGELRLLQGGTETEAR